AEAIIELARDRRHVGGTVGVMAVLHTWTQQLIYHPHVHCLVTGGGVSDDGRDWHPARDHFLIPPRPLAGLARGKMRPALANPPRSCCARPSGLGARSVGSTRTEAGGRRSRRYGERLFRSIAVLAAAPLPVLQGRPPRVCAQAIPQTGTWTMTRWNERQRLRLRVPVTPRIAAAHTLRSEEHTSELQS